MFVKMKTFMNLMCLVSLVNGFDLNSSVRNDTISDFEHKSEVLSRRKRFIVFPEGSSVQLVFCVTYPMIFMIGDIFLYGYTAALAWELPQDPYSPFDHHADPLHRRSDSTSVYFTDERGKVLFKRPYKKKAIINPAFAKRSVDSRPHIGEDSKKGTLTIDRKRMHSERRARDFLKIDQQNSQFHRSSRASLYEKIESLLKAFGVDGKQCLLKTLCQIGQAKNLAQGDFVQEILMTVFTLPKGRRFEDQEHREYEEAHSSTGSCDQLYPECQEPVSRDGTPDFNY